MNICKEKGIDFEAAFSNFKQQFKGFIFNLLFKLKEAPRLSNASQCWIDI